MPCFLISFSGTLQGKQFPNITDPPESYTTPSGNFKSILKGSKKLFVSSDQKSWFQSEQALVNARWFCLWLHENKYFFSICSFWRLSDPKMLPSSPTVILKAFFFASPAILLTVHTRKINTLNWQ